MSGFVDGKKGERLFLSDGEESGLSICMEIRAFDSVFSCAETAMAGFYYW